MKERWTPHIIAVMAFVVFIVLGVACASSPTPSIDDVDASRRPLKKGEQIIGSVQVEFTSPHNVDLLGQILTNDLAYDTLLIEARKQFQGNIDVRDIICVYGGLARVSYGYNITASGNIVSLEGGNRRTTDADIEGALARAAKQTLKNVPKRSRIAIVFITAQDRSTTDYIAGELEFIWVNGGYIITDRSQLDRLRQEQNFQLSGEVDDATAVSIGKFAGANIIVTGRVDGEGDLRRLRLRALDTQTAQVVGVASERL
jgi:hypothetical protein